MTSEPGSGSSPAAAAWTPSSTTWVGTSSRPCSTPWPSTDDRSTSFPWAARRVSFDLSSFYHRRLTLYGLDTMAMNTVVSGTMPGFRRAGLRPRRVHRPAGRRHGSARRSPRSLSPGQSRTSEREVGNRLSRLKLLRKWCRPTPQTLSGFFLKKNTPDGDLKGSQFFQGMP